MGLELSVSGLASYLKCQAACPDPILFTRLSLLKSQYWSREFNISIVTAFRALLG